MRHAWRTLALLVLLTPLAMGNASCAVVAWFAAQFAPKEKVEAEYEPPKGKKVLVFVDDILSPVTYEPVKIELTNQLNRQLLAHRVAGKTLSYDRLADMIAATPDFNLLSVSEVGEKLGAELVLYVQIDRFALRDDAAKELWHGRLQATVRVVEVGKGRLWPKDRPGGYPLEEVETPVSTDSSPTYGDEITRSLAAQMGEQIARLFYDHEAVRARKRADASAWSR